jgi:hypothetical protein
LTSCLFNQQVAHSGTVPNAKWATVYVDEEKRDAVRDAMRDAYNAYETYAMGEFTLIMMLTAIRMTPCYVYSYRVRRAPAADQTR